MRKAVFALLVTLLLVTAAGAFAYELLPEDTGFTVMAENDAMVLMLNQKNLDVRIRDKASGTTLDTAAMNGQQGNKAIKNLQKAMLNVYYIANARNGTTSYMDTYSMAVEKDTFEVEQLKNGFAIHYTIGDNTLGIDDLPKAIEGNKYKELLVPNWTSKETKTFNEQYRNVERADGTAYYVRLRDPDSSTSMGQLLVKQLHDLIFTKGQYTLADMEEDNAAYNYQRSYLPELKVTICFYLDGGDLVVSIPASSITTTPTNDVTIIDVMPYFMSADTGKTGYIVVPDGSGALINFNNSKIVATSYNAKIYGQDILINALTYTTPRERISLPIYGIKIDDIAVLAIIEKGAEIASLYADVSGRSDEYNRIGARFTLREIESIALAGNNTITSSRFSPDIYQGDIVTRYKLLLGEDATYTGMAKTYQQYLVDQGDLVKQPTEDQAPFFVEMIGAVTKTKFFVGIPYISTVQATTFSEASAIYQALRAAGIRNIKLMYNGIFYGGIKHASLTSVALDGGMGGQKALAALQQQLAANGDTLFPAVYMESVHTSRNFNRLTQAARRQDGEPAEIISFAEPILKQGYNETQGYYVSPHYLSTYVQRALKALKPYNFDSLNILDLGTILVGDYKRRDDIARVHAAPYAEAALEALAKEHSLMLDKPNAYALRYAAYATNLPSGDNGFMITDAAIPLTQLVLEGCIPYSGTSWNTQSYLGLEAQFLYALESKSSPRFTFTYQPPTIFHNTTHLEYEKYFTSQYHQWLDMAADLYAQYNAFYQQVKDASITAHEILSGSLRRITYSNGVVLYVNYGTQAVTKDGVTVPAQGYVVKGGTGT